MITADRRPEEKSLNLGVVKRPERSIGYAVETIDETQISPQDIDLETAVTGQFTNVKIKSDEDITQFLSRGRNMSILLDQTGLLVIDGVPMQSDPKFLGGVSTDKAIISKSGLLHPDNIAEITVLKGLAATNRWGTLGRNGVILVTTKAGSQLATEDGEFNNGKIGTTDTYEGGALLMEDLPNTEYIEALSTAKSVDEAYNIYLKQRGYFGDSPEFFFNTATYFKKWQNNFVIDKILSNVSELPDVNTETQMALVYKLQEMGLYDSATKVINNIIEDKPTQLQHYRNLALNYHLAGEYQKSLDLYKKIDRKQIKGITSLDNLQGTIDNEYKNLLALHSDDIEMKGINPKMLTNVKLDTRIVFEWNNFDAEFDLQIVNPQNRYFTWSHTKEGEPSRINKEKQLGYGLEEYFMTVDDKGIWLFNITYYGDGDGNSNEPLYLKVTKYDNFGSINQSQHTEVIAIEEVDKTQTLMTIKI
ncbi:MAG: hypothetical protein R3213_03855 [Flavobacteriaceae bacterium]|nr:hypothetical protein [Flavobacteriaceae bacterium]